MISEALLKEVIKKETSITNFIDDSRKIYNIGSTIVIPTTYGSHDYNIYELAHKCKEWAWRKGYLLSSSCRNGDNYAFCKVYQREIAFRCETEPEAVFKACEWILKNQ